MLRQHSIIHDSQAAHAWLRSWWDRWHWWRVLFVLGSHNFLVDLMALAFHLQCQGCISFYSCPCAFLLIVDTEPPGVWIQPSVRHSYFRQVHCTYIHDTNLTKHSAFILQLCILSQLSWSLINMWLTLCNSFLWNSCAMLMLNKLCCSWLVLNLALIPRLAWLSSRWSATSA